MDDPAGRRPARTVGAVVVVTVCVGVPLLVLASLAVTGESALGVVAVGLVGLLLAQVLVARRR